MASLLAFGPSLRIPRPECCPLHEKDPREGGPLCEQASFTFLRKAKGDKTSGESGKVGEQAQLGVT